MYPYRNCPELYWKHICLLSIYLKKRSLTWWCAILFSLVQYCKVLNSTPSSDQLLGPLLSPGAKSVFLTFHIIFCLISFHSFTFPHFWYSCLWTSLSRGLNSWKTSSQKFFLFLPEQDCSGVASVFRFTWLAWPWWWFYAPSCAYYYIPTRYFHC